MTQTKHERGLAKPEASRPASEPNTILLMYPFLSFIFFSPLNFGLAGRPRGFWLRQAPFMFLRTILTLLIQKVVQHFASLSRKILTPLIQKLMPFILSITQFYFAYNSDYSYPKSVATYCFSLYAQILGLGQPKAGRE